MSSGTVLVVSHEQDGHANYVLEKARELSIDAILWDISKYPEESEISVGVVTSEASDPIRIKVNGVTHQLGDIAGIWWRRPNGGGSRRGGETKMEQYVRIESEFLVRSLKDLVVSANWVSDPESTRLACRKPVQLLVAKRIGLCTPNTCITNSPDSFLEFLESLDGRKMTMKPVGSAFIPLDSEGSLSSTRNRVVFTKVVDPRLITRHLDMVKNCPVIFQEVVEKDFDIRVTVVDGEVFAAAVHLVDFIGDHRNLDWRNHAGRREYRRHILPDDVASRCIEVTKALGLRFGCIDLAFSHKNGYTFFEINPQGQWLPSEWKLGYNISGSLLNSLIK